jgi:hypothetical protein
MRRERRSHGPLAAWVVVAVLGCAQDDAPARSRVLDAAEARHLVGVWDVSFRLDPATSVTIHAVSALPVTGTLVFAEDHYGRVTSAELSEPTHDGVYDVDFRPFGFSSRDADAIPVAVARVAPRSTGDSLYVVLSPGNSRFAVRMEGALAGDSAAGRWRAAAFSAGGGSGRFTMHRERDPP